jgi:hypothetical protein
MLQVSCFLLFPDYLRVLGLGVLLGVLHPLMLYIRSGHEGWWYMGKSRPCKHGVFDVVGFWS